MSDIFDQLSAPIASVRGLAIHADGKKERISATIHNVNNPLFSLPVVHINHAKTGDRFVLDLQSATTMDGKPYSENDS